LSVTKHSLAISSLRQTQKNLVSLTVLLIAVSLIVSFIYTLLVSIGPSSACRSPTEITVEPGTTTARPLISDGQARCYQLYVPPGYDPAQAHPLVVVLHGLASNGDMIKDVTGWDGVADREGLIIAYPDGMGYPLRWNANSNMNLAEDDVQFFRHLVAEVSTLVSVDLARVYVNGFSNGATMSAVIGCQAADVVAAIGLVDPGILTEETLAGCSPARPVPGIEFVGTGDVGTASVGSN
jgi:polyhydroxybutyrate depolymerase